MARVRPDAQLTGKSVIETTNWPELARSLSAEFRNLRGGAPEVMKAFSSIAQAALAQGALDPKTKELIALGIAVAIRCDDCSPFTSRPQSNPARRARRFSKRSAWRSIWALARPRCTQVTRLAPTHNSPRPGRAPASPKLMGRGPVEEQAGSTSSSTPACPTAHYMAATSQSEEGTR